MFSLIRAPRKTRWLSAFGFLVFSLFVRLVYKTYEPEIASWARPKFDAFGGFLMGFSPIDWAFSAVGLIAAGFFLVALIGELYDRGLTPAGKERKGRRAEFEQEFNRLQEARQQLRKYAAQAFDEWKKGRPKWKNSQWEKFIDEGQDPAKLPVSEKQDLEKISFR